MLCRHFSLRVVLHFYFFCVWIHEISANLNQKLLNKVINVGVQLKQSCFRLFRRIQPRKEFRITNEDTGEAMTLTNLHRGDISSDPTCTGFVLRRHPMIGPLPRLQFIGLAYDWKLALQEKVIHFMNQNWIPNFGRQS